MAYDISPNFEACNVWKYQATHKILLLKRKQIYLDQPSDGSRLSLASMPYDSTNVDILLHQFSRLLTLQRLIRLRDLICFDVSGVFKTKKQPDKNWNKQITFRTCQQIVIKYTQQRLR